VIDIHVPKMGMSTVEVDIMSIHVTVGQEVAPDQPLVEIESEKATFEVTAGCAGIVREILVREGDVCEVGHVLMRVEPGA
jgi:pyruvate/2-oxoglutarate dehydrogenase complex dihydrolipoamide acyltransferase (E2) component